MKLYQNLNNYLLRNHPSIWITRIHLFVPIGLAIFFLLFGVNVLIGYDLNTTIPDEEDSIFLMIIPVLIYLVYWFVFQARYNVVKSGGKLTLLQDYVNYFSYFLMFLLSFLIVMAIPLSSNFKVAHSISNDELRDDVEILNSGYGIFHLDHDIKIENNDYLFRKGNYFRQISAPIGSVEVKMSQVELKVFTKNYIETYNKYADIDYKITRSSAALIKIALAHDNLPKDSRWRKSVSYKIGRIVRLKKKGWYHDYVEDIAIKVLGSVLALLALLVWIFKQIFWKQYVFGLVALFLTPLFVAIVGLLLFEMFRFDESLAFILVFLTYFIFAVKIIVNLNLNLRNNAATVMAMYLQLALPFLPLLIFGSMDSRFRSFEENFELIYAISWGVGLLSIAVFKAIYKQLSILPAKK